MRQFDLIGQLLFESLKGGPLGCAQPLVRKKYTTYCPFGVIVREIIEPLHEVVEWLNTHLEVRDGFLPTEMRRGTFEDAFQSLAAP